MQLAKTNQTAVQAFTSLGPTYCSSNTVVGENECKILFPDGYDMVAAEKVVATKKKSKKKLKKLTAQNEEDTDGYKEAIEDVEFSEGTLIDDGELEDIDLDEDDEEFERTKYADIRTEFNETDKATSPMSSE